MLKLMKYDAVFLVFVAECLLSLKNRKIMNLLI